MNGAQTDIRGYCSDIYESYEEGGAAAAAASAARGAMNGLWFSATSRLPLGTNVFEKEWDLLLILDACRVDALEAVASEYDFIGDVGSILSVGSASHEWMAKTFTSEYRREIGRTAMVTSNPFFDRLFERDITPPFSYSVPFSYAQWDPVSKDDFCYTEWVNEHVDPYCAEAGIERTGSAEYMTDRTVLAGREQGCDRLIAHYYQPHRPFIDRALETGDLTDLDNHPYEQVRSGDLSEAELWNRYLDNLRYALDSIEVLLRNIDAEKVAISADHGELLGELGQYGHPEGVFHPALKRVPWAETTAVDKGEYEPSAEVEYDSEYDAEARLEALGYI